jgi:tetratricopeptide (TPR) repeat protein
MMVCHYCETKLDDGAKFCANCGKTAAEVRPGSAKEYFRRGTAYGEEGDYDRAIDDLIEVIRLDPDDAAAYRNRGFAYAEQGRGAEAIQDLETALRLAPYYEGTRDAQAKLRELRGR